MQFDVCPEGVTPDKLGGPLGPRHTPASNTGGGGVQTSGRFLPPGGGGGGYGGLLGPLTGVPAGVGPHDAVQAQKILHFNTTNNFGEITTKEFLLIINYNAVLCINKVSSALEKLHCVPCGRALNNLISTMMKSGGSIFKENNCTILNYFRF